MRIAALLLLLSLPALAKGNKHGGDDPDMKQLESYVLTVGNIEKVMSATDKLNALQQKNPALKEKYENMNAGEAKHLDDTVKRLESMPEVMSVLKSVNLSARDFVLTSMAGMQAAMVAGMRKQYPQTANKPVEGLNPKNVEFVDQHEALVKKWAAQAQPSDKGGDTKDDE